MRQALITRITGQDGGYLSKLLLEDGYRVYGLDRHASTPTTERLQYLDVLDRITLLDGGVTDQGSMVRALEAAEPDERLSRARRGLPDYSRDKRVQGRHRRGIPQLVLGTKANH